ncbi:hypothetical protein CROQUDRAFT_133901 [Cronartium quercuum f. sp. fusiforme G11]|uniref:Uncharacterized protein n=1 Tax=Cronartium quercuum f. sp. fusiforme G11 TaxID=708437 RepID=A0A9P6NEA7_9BASI|nr:hypothetical protein CROQUDRAFT_133901 [Cronartium quercuum f. sp. fusiforme G11]
MNAANSSSRPFHISRATDEITQFPSYETMHQLSTSPNSRSHSAALFATLAGNKLGSNHGSAKGSPHSRTSRFANVRIGSSSTHNNLSSSASTLNSAELATATRRSSGAFHFLTSLVPGLSSPRSYSAQNSHVTSTILLDHGDGEGDSRHADRQLNCGVEVDEQALNSGQAIARLVPLTISLLSSNLVFTVLIWYSIPFLIKLELSAYSKTLLWLASPISSLLVPPLVGTISDLSYKDPHRRRVWIAGSTFLLLVSLLTLSFCQPMGALVTYIIGGDQGDWDPERAIHVEFNSTCIGIISLYASFLALDTLTLSSRALMLDQVLAINQNSVNVWASRMAHLGNLIGFTIVCFSDARHGSKEPQLLRELVGYSIPLLILTSSLTCLTQTECPPSKYTHRPSSMNFRHLFKFFKQFLRTLPIPIRRVCYVQVFSSIGWLTILYHAKSLVTRFTLVEMTATGSALTEPLIRYSERQGSMAMLKFSIVSLASSIVLPFLCAVGQTKYVVEKRGRRWNKFRKFLTTLTPRNVWTTSFVGYVVLMCCTFGIDTAAGASAVVILLGLPWAVAQWVPFALLMEYTRSIEETSTASTEVTHPPSPPLRPRRSSVLIATPPQVHKFEPRANERTGLLSSPPEESVPGLSLLMGAQPSSTQTGGCTLAVHELAKVAPHFLVSIITSIMFNIVYFITTTTEISFSSSSSSAPVERPTDLLWFFRLTAFSALSGMFLTRRIVVPTSELEYWDELEYQIYESERAERGSLLEDAG